MTISRARSSFARVVRSPRITCKEDVTMRGVLLWLVGIPIPVIILLYLFHVL